MQTQHFRNRLSLGGDRRSNCGEHLPGDPGAQRRVSRGDWGVAIWWRPWNGTEKKKRKRLRFNPRLKNRRRVDCSERRSRPRAAIRSLVIRNLNAGWSCAGSLFWPGPDFNHTIQDGFELCERNL